MLKKNNRFNRLLLLVWLGLLWILSPGASAQSETGNQDKIALVMKALSNPFFFKMEDGAKSYAQENGIRLEVFGTELETDIDHQIDILNHLISRRYGAIVIAPADSRKLTPILQRALDQGIVVINIDNPLEPDAQTKNRAVIPFVGADNAKGAALIGDYLRRKLGGKGRIMLIEGIAGARNGALRKQGFLQAVTLDGGIEVVASASANWQTEDAFASASSLLDQHGPVDAIFCANDQMALGVLQALDARHLAGKVRVTGYDNIDAMRNELRNGRIHATVEQHPELMGRYGVALAFQAMQGQKIPARQETPLDLIVADSFGQRIALSLSDLGNPFFAAMFRGAQAQADLHGVELSYADAANDDARQLVAIQQFVDQAAKVLIINPTNAQAVVPGIEIANRARIPVITVDRKADSGAVAAHITSDNLAGGRLAGEYLTRRLEQGGVIAEFEGIPGTSVSYERGKGFNDALAKQPKLRVTRREVAHFNRAEARAAMTELLAEGQRFDALFAHNDNMILGVMEALHHVPPAQRPILIGFDGIPEALRAVREGDIAATVVQKPERMGALAVNAALALLRGEPVTPTILVELDLAESAR